MKWVQEKNEKKEITVASTNLDSMIIFGPAFWHFNKALPWSPPEYLEFPVRHKAPFSVELSNLYGAGRTFVVPSKGVADNVFGIFGGLVIAFRVLVAKYNSCGANKGA